MRLSKTHRVRLEQGIVLIAAVGLHALVLLLLARPVILIFPDYSNDEDTVDVSLERPRRPAPPAAGGETTGPAPRAPAIAPPATVEVLPLAPFAAGPTTGPGPAAASPHGDLGAALRSGGYACGSGRRALLTPEERARCEEKLGALAVKAPPLPAPIDPDKRAYYDAVAQAYDNGGAMVTLTAPGAAGMLDLPPATTTATVLALDAR